MSTLADKLGIGVIGCGHWGPNHIRVFNELDTTQVVACADSSARRLERVQHRFAGLQAYADYHALLNDPRVGAVVICTPTATHYAIARDALRAGKHVLVEKPMCTNGAQGRELVRLADETGLVLMVGHVFLFNNGIVRLRELVRSGELGRIHYVDAVRTNLGPIRGDVNALYDLGTHDISICNFLLDAAPIEVSAHGRCITQPRVEDVCFTTLKYPNGTLGHVHVSWLNPRKVRTLTVVGENKMAFWDDIDPSDTLRIFDKGVAEPPYYDSFGEYQYLLRSADVHLPAIRRTEPLLNQAEAFAKWVQTGVKHGPDAREGLTVVNVLEAAMRSMRQEAGMNTVESNASVLVERTAAANGLHPTSYGHWITSDVESGVGIGVGV